MNDGPLLPRYPIFIPSKGRADVDLTTRFMLNDGVPFRLVVEPQEAAAYAGKYGRERVLVLPRNDQGLVYARNWIWEFAVSEKWARHWQIDDNISGVWRWYKGTRLYCHAGPAFRACEDFVDRYENVAIAGLNYVMFAVQARAPFTLNAHVYSCTLIQNEIPFRYRPPANEDVDICLQVLSAGWCTVLFNAFLIQKLGTMIVKGGQTDAAYRGDGRLYMARQLERKWPGVVRVDRRWGRPQHVISYNWKRFDNRLRPRPDFDRSALPAVDEYGLRLTEKRPVRSRHLRSLLAERATTKGDQP